MAIEFSCQCGKQIKVSEKLAGRRAKCPGCGQPITIPEVDAPLDDIDGNLLYEAIGTSSNEPEQVACANCHRSIPATASVCPHCGYNRAQQSHYQMAQAMAEPEKREGSRPLFSILGIDMSVLKLLVVLVPLIGLPGWYYMFPGKSMHVRQMQVVSLVEAVKSGQVQKPVSTSGTLLSTMLEHVNKDSKPPTFEEAHEASYTLGSSDSLVVSKPDDDGDHILLKVGLRQQTINDKGSTALYDTIIRGDDFKLEPAAGGPDVDGARILYYQFEGNSKEIDLFSSDTSSFKSLFPCEPTQIDTEKADGVIDGTAVWNQPTAKGQIKFRSYYSTGDYPSPTGLNAEGKLEVFNEQGATVDMFYTGGSLDVKWDSDSTGWWTRKRYDETSHDWPWYRYEFGLLFERPQAGGKYNITYRDSKVGTIYLEDKPVPKPPPVSPIKRVKNPGSNNIDPNNPLAYFEILADARKSAQGIVSANNLRQIGFGLQLYLDQNAQQWPDNIEQLKGVINDYDQIMVNPRTKTRPGFIYIKPERGADPATTAVVYENWQGQPDPNGAVLYADGHIE